MIITYTIVFIRLVGNGVASDFQGSYYVGDTGRMAFGEPTRALKMNIADLPGNYKMATFILSYKLDRL